MCRCLREYIPVLKRSLECFVCQTIINPTTPQTTTRSPLNQQQLTNTPRTTQGRKRRKKKRFRLTMPPHEAGDRWDRLFMPSPSSSSLTSINNDRTAEYTPDTPESTNCKQNWILLLLSEGGPLTRITF